MREACAIRSRFSAAFSSVGAVIPFSRSQLLQLKNATSGQVFCSNLRPCSPMQDWLESSIRPPIIVTSICLNSAKKSAICRSLVITRSGKCVICRASSIIVVPASRTTESPALTIDAAALAMACFSARLRCIFSWVVGWVGINRLRVTPPCVRLITPCSSSFIRSRRIVAGDALVTATSSSTVTRLWLFR